MEKLIVALFGALFLFVLTVFFAFLFAVITQYAWANSVAQIFHLSELTFWQAFWLNVFGGMVFKGSSVSKS